MISWLFCTIALVEIIGLANGASVRQASPSFLKELERAADGDIGLLHRNGYTLVQYREEGGEDFYRETWNDYRNGFGSSEDTPEGKGYWIGLDELHRRTSEGRYELIVVARSSSYPTFSYCHYKDFKVGTELYGYKLHLGERGKCTGIFAVRDGEGDEKGDLFEKSSNGATFSTPDHDNDESEENCAQQQSAGWWFGWDCAGFCANCRGALEYDGENKIITETHMGMKRIETPTHQDCVDCEHPPDGGICEGDYCPPCCPPSCAACPECDDCHDP